MTVCGPCPVSPPSRIWSGTGTTSSKTKSRTGHPDAALFLMAEGLFVFLFLLVSLQQLLLNIGRYLLVFGHLHGEGSAS